VVGRPLTPSTTVKGISLLSTAPVTSTSPIVVGDNDPRVQQLGGYWRPAHNGMLAGNYDPTLASGTSSPTNGNIHLIKLYVPNTILATNIAIGWTGVSGAGVTGYVGIYNSSGTRLAVSTAQSTSFQTGSAGQVPLSSSVTITGGADTWVYIAVLVASATTAPVWRSISQAASSINFGLANAQYRACINGTGQTTLPASLTLSSNNGNTALWPWVGIT
jgi:hypothetical protein